MSSITYAGHSFADYVRAELVEPVAHVVTPETARVPGRPGLALLSADVEPLGLRVRLLDALTVAQRADVRRTLRAWLLNTEDGTLVVPGKPELTWHDVLCAGASGWSSLFAEGTAAVTFECLDPIAYGDAASSDAGSFDVGGTWVTWPVISMVASAGDSVQVTDVATGAYVLVEYSFATEDAVLIDCGAQKVTVNGTDATADVALGSDFFALAPGACELVFSGCSAHTVSWVERWA